MINVSLRAKSGLLCIVLALWGSALFISPKAESVLLRQDPLHHGVSVTLKLIQVYVTDKSGRPVTDLSKEEFEVYDNGRPVAITEFEQHDLSPAGHRLKSTREQREQDVSVPGRQELTALKRKFIIFFDFAFNSAKGVAVGVKAALEFLDTKVGPGDETALLSYSMFGGLKIHEFLTSDHAKVRKAVCEITGREVAGRADEIEQAYWRMVEMAGAGNNPKVQTEMKTLEMERWDSAQQAGNYIVFLRSFAEALRLVHGQKHILFFSNGIPSSLINSTRTAGTDSIINPPGLGAFGGRPATGSRFEIGDSILQPLLEAMLKEFNSANCSLYAFDTRESAKIASLFAFDETAFARRTGGMFSADNVGTSVTNPFRDEKTTGMDTLKRMSGQTGGRYYGSIGSYDRSLNEVSEATGTFYVLGYPIAAEADGKYHVVRVRMKRKGCTVRAQRGYFNPKPFSDYTDIEKKLHLFDLALNGKSDVSVPVECPMSVLGYSAANGTSARCITRIPGQVWDEFEGDAAEIITLYFNENGDLLDLHRALVSIPEYRGKDLVFTASTTAPPGSIDCRIVVRDLDSGQSALARGKAFIKGRARTGFDISSPLLLAPGGGASLLNGVTAGQAEIPAWQDIYAFNWRAVSPLLGDEPTTAEKILLIVPVLASVDSGSELVLKLDLVDSTTGKGGIVQHNQVNRTRVVDYNVIYVEVSTDSIPAGKYLLYIHIGGKVSGNQAVAHIPLTLEKPAGYS